MKSLFEYLFGDKKEKKLVQYFSEEYKDRLIQEHKLISACIARLNQTNIYQNYARNHGRESVSKAFVDLQSQKVELEIKIDVINDFFDD